MAEVKVAFRAGLVPKPLKEAINVARRRQVMDIRRFNALNDRSRLTSFSVAGDLSNRSISTILKASTTAIENGQTYNQFKKTLSPALVGRITAPEVVYRNNAQNAYQRSRFNTQDEIKQLRPFYRYRTFGDERVRPNHALMNGMTAPASSDIWQKNYPPNGHLCRCVVDSFTRQWVDRNNIHVLKNQKGLDRFARDKQLKQGVPKSQLVRPLADKGWRTSFTPNEGGATSLIQAFDNFRATKWASLLIPQNPNKVTAKAKLAKRTQNQRMTDYQKYLFKNKTLESAVAVDNKANLVLLKSGSLDSVELTATEKLKMFDSKGLMTLHNHTNKTSFSAADFDVFASTQTREMRIVTENHLFHIQAPAGYSYRELEKNALSDYAMFKIAAEEELKRKVTTIKLTPAELNELSTHMASREMAKKYNLDYRRQVHHYKLF